MRPWLAYALITTVFWGVWGAFAGAPIAYGFPETLIYCVWSLTMIPPALFALWRDRWHIDHSWKAVLYGSAIGLLGAGGQMLLFVAVRHGPAYLIFPITSLSPVVTIAMSFILMGERTGRIGAFGVVLALLALPLFDYEPGQGVHFGTWFVLSILVFLAWGVQAYLLKPANHICSPTTIFFYMCLSGLALVPIALALTDFSQPIAYGLRGPWLAAGVQTLNSIGALTLVYAFRYGRAVIVAPLINAGYPMLTALISMAVLGVVPSAYKLAGIVLALLGSVLLAIEPEAPAPATARGSIPVQAR